jgi:hypothetical protein
MPFNGWKSNLLSKRDLGAPDRRPLYAYRLDSSEFQSLENLLKKKLTQYKQAGYRLGYGRPISLGLISEQVSGFPALFVLYAAEWWRQRYDGTGWSWQPILSDLGVDSDDWSASERSACITKGLQDWGLSALESCGLRYLGAIALQGGLPMRLLAEAKGGIGNLLRGVLKEAARSRVTVHDIQGWVKSLESLLPRTYRQPEIHVLLAQVVDTALRLKEEAKLTQSDDAIMRLEQHNRSWRDRFPLPINDLNARGLIEQLIRDAAAVKIDRRAVSFRIERFLEKDSDGLWHLCSRLILPDTNTIDSAMLGELFAETAAAFPRLLDIALKMNKQDQTLSLRRLIGHDKYRIERRPCGATDQDAANEHILRLSTADGRMWNIPAPRGEELDDDLPWVFDARDESQVLLRQGAGSVAPHEAIVAIPRDWVTAPEDGAILNVEGSAQDFKKHLYRIRGTVRFSDSQGESYRVRTGRTTSGQENYTWIGQRSWEEFNRPRMAFLGMPQLYRMNEEGVIQLVDGKCGWRPLGGGVFDSGSNIFGPIEVRYPAVGEVKYRTRMTILPPNASFRLEFNDAGSGHIHLENWRVIDAQVLNSNTRWETSHAGNRFTVSLHVKTGERAPEWVDLNAYWRDTPTPARLRLPYPAKGARVYDADGHELRSGTLVAANRLLGIRIHALGGNPAAMPRMTLELRLNKNCKESCYNVFPPSNSVQVEIRLQDYVGEIAHLLANNDAPDTMVEAALRIGGEIATRLSIARYSFRMQRDDIRGQVYVENIEVIEPDQLESLPVMALRLQAPEEEAIHLTPVTPEGVATGAWEFAPQMRDCGSWLIFPSSVASLQFRPILWTIAGEPGVNGHVAQSVGIPQQIQRESALDTAIEVLAGNFLDPGWTDVERLANQIGHLSLVTLDLWRRFARSPSGMASLAMRFHRLPDRFLTRFPEELPFSWETVPYETWYRAIKQLKGQCDEQYKTASETVFKAHVENRLSELNSRYLALNNLLHFAYAAIIGHAPPEIRAFRHPDALAQLNNILFSGGESFLQRLLRNNSSAQWPTTFNRRIGEARVDSLLASLLYSTDDYRDGLINLPILLAIHVATNATEEWFEVSERIYDLRSHIAFDLEWFTEAYNLTIARCLSVGLLKVEV